MEEKRRLPSWMVGASTANKASKPLDANSSSVVTKSAKAKVKSVTRNHKKEIRLSGDENILVKCETKRKKRGFVEKDVTECHDLYQEIGVEKRKSKRVKRKPKESEPSRKKIKKNYESDSGNENQALSCDEEDDDLTMDDVLRIAKEFVENDKSETGQQKPPEVQCELKSKSAYVRSPVHEEIDSDHEHIEATNEITLADSKMSGDPAQDMLELFLGPLLNKPIVKKTSSTDDDIINPHEIKNQQHVAAVISNKPVTLTKKKSSLRDAVAMFLD